MLINYFEKAKKILNAMTIFVIPLNRDEEVVEAANFNGSLAEAGSSKRVPLLLPLSHSYRTFKARM